MQLNIIFRNTITLILLALLSSSVFATQAPQDDIAINTNLEETKSKYFDEFLLSPEIQLSGYSKVYIEQPSVIFDEDWYKEHRHDISKNYPKKTSVRYSDMFKRELEKAFNKHDKFEVVKEKASDVLVINVIMKDLDIHAPETLKHTKNYVQRVGDARIDATLLDNKGNALAKFIDHRETLERGINQLQKANRATNQHDFRLMMGNWSRQMAKHIAVN